MKKILIIILFFYAANLVLAQNGIRKIYYSKGKLESAVSFSNEVLDGNAKWYYENGNLKTEKTYSSGVLNGWIREFYENGLLKEEHFVRNGVLDGISKKHFDNGALKEVKTFDKGKLQGIKSFDYDSLFGPTLELFVGRSTKVSKKNQDELICEIDVCPQPLGGIEAIEKNIIYPIIEKQNKVECFVLVTALINKKGIAENVNIIKGAGQSFDNAAIKAVQKTIFIPGINKNTIVSSEVTFRVNFKLKK